MSTEDSILKSVAAATPKLVQLLTPLTREGRQRALISAMAIFGETPPSAKPLRELFEGDANQDATIGDGICPKALSWLKKNSITREQLEHVFSIEKDAIDTIASNMPGKNKRQQTIQAYVICGAAIFLRSGEVKFTDKDARALCVKVGAYDVAHHAENMKEFGNFVTGTKDTGWKITNPGLNEAAKTIKELAPGLVA